MIVKTWFKALSCLLLLGLFQTAAAQAAPVIIPAPPQVSAKAYILLDANTGKVLVEENADEVLPPASLTKMMTIYVVSEEIARGRLKESDLVRVSDDAWKRGGEASGSSTMFLKPRSEVPVIDLMRGVIIQSGNDASIALAQHLAGGEGAFADVMNQYAQLIGMNSSHFVNATGWPAEGHESTARDLATLARAVIQDHPEHYKIYSEKEFTHNGIRQSNRNTLLFSDPSIDGLKTGHTNAAGFCLVSSAKKNGMRLISVVLGTNSKNARAVESKKLLSYGFRYFQTQTLYSADKELSSNRVWKGQSDQVSIGVLDDVVVTIPRGSKESLEATMSVDTLIEAPIKKGQVLGELLVSLDGEEIYKTDLVALDEVAEAGFFARIWDSIAIFFNGLFK